jgi:hypothetical protein
MTKGLGFISIDITYQGVRKIILVYYTEGVRILGIVFIHFMSLFRA